MICTNCGTQNQQGEMFCSKCGMKLVPQPQQSMNQQPMNQQSMNQQSMNQQPMNQQSMNQQPMNQQSMNQQFQQNENMQYSSNNWTTNQNSSKRAVNPKIGMWVIIPIIVLIICLIGYFVWSILMKSSSTQYNINIETKANIKANAYVSFDNHEIILYMTNNEDDIGVLNIESKYIDKEGNIIRDDKNLVSYFKKGTDAVSTIWLPQDSDYNYYVPDNIEIKISVDEGFDFLLDEVEMYDDKVSADYKVENDKVNVTLTNHSNVTLDEVEAAVLFMKNNKPIAVDSISGSDIAKTYTDFVEIPIDWDKSDEEDVLLEYDSIKIVINGAVKER